MNVDTAEIVGAVRSVVGTKVRPIGHHDACVTAEDRHAVNDRLELDGLDGEVIEELECELAKVCGVGFAVATSSGTAALGLALRAVGVESGDEVLVPSMTFVATANAVSHVDADPFFLDCSLSDFGINPHKLSVVLDRETTRSLDGVLLHRARRIAAIVPVHVFGMPCRIKEILTIAAAYGIPVIEDAAQALGSVADGRPCGSWGRASILSFNVNKIITGVGGALLTDDHELAAKVRSWSATARIPHPWDIAHSTVAWNHRMSPLSAALILSQLRRLPAILQAKRAINERYRLAFLDVEGVGVGTTDGWNHWQSFLMLDERCSPDDRRDVFKALHADGLMARAAFTPMHQLPAFGACYSDNPLVSEAVWRRVVCLPSGIGLASK